jgi:polar amino acid transport system substrate-binding protein
MNTRNLLTFVAIAMMILLAACSGGQTVEAEASDACLGTAEDAVVDLDCQAITIGVENAYPPFNYITESGEPDGWDYAAWTEICTRLHCEPVFTEIAWESLIQSVADGQVDVVADGLTITEDRAEIVDFSDGYIAIEQRLLVRSGESRFSSIDDFVANPELRLGTQSGTTNYEVAASYLPEDQIDAFEQFPFAVQALIAGDVDAVIIDEFAGMGYLGINAEDLELIGPSMSSDALAFLFPIGSDLVDPINQVIAELQAENWFDTINQEYIATSAGAE